MYPIVLTASLSFIIIKTTYWQRKLTTTVEEKMNIQQYVCPDCGATAVLRNGDVFRFECGAEFSLSKSSKGYKFYPINEGAVCKNLLHPEILEETTVDRTTQERTGERLYISESFGGLTPNGWRANVFVGGIRVVFPPARPYNGCTIMRLKGVKFFKCQWPGNTWLQFEDKIPDDWAAQVCESYGMQLPQ